MNVPHLGASLKFCHGRKGAVAFVITEEEPFQISHHFGIGGLTIVALAAQRRDLSRGVILQHGN
jgi:hypothetical protein